jgi:photosystem II stability/assembly factor-like uncharacterized protein
MGVIRSDDGGLSWTNISGGADGPVDFHAIAIAEGEPEKAYGLYQGGIQASTDGGKSWAWAGTAPAQTFDLAATGADGMTVFAAAADGIWESVDGGQSWSRQAGDFGMPASLIEVTTDRMYAFFVGRGFVERGLQEEGWTPLANDFGDEVLLHLAASSRVPELLAAVTQNSGVLLSKDGGRTWAQMQ